MLDCSACGKPFELAPGPKRGGRKRCYECSPAAHKAVEVQELADEHPLVASTRRRLTGIGRCDSPEGALALTLAGEIAEHAGGSAMGVASLATAFQKAIDVATQGAVEASDALDELKRRREARVSGA